jgi:adenylate cyclase
MRQLISQAITAFNNLLYKYTILVLTLLFCIGLSAALWNMSRLSSNIIQSQALQNAALYAEASKEARTLYSDEVVNRAKAVPGVIVTHDYKNKKGAIPVPATYLIELAHRLTEKNHDTSVRLYSDYPFPSRLKEGGIRDDFEREALNKLRENPQQPFFRFEKLEGRSVLRYAQADIMKPSCVSCHNTNPDSPKKDWKVGDVRGVLEITTPLDNFMVQTDQGLRSTVIMLGILSIPGILGLTIVMGRLRQTSREL